MKKEELMIGDWVNFNGTIDKVQEILYVEGEGYCASFAASATLFPMPLDKITPIPLNTEVLGKSGFHFVPNHISGYFKANNKYLELSIYENKEIDWTINGCEYTICTLKYVHELQHALKLYGIEKEIVL